MALTIPTTETDKISLEEFAEACDAQMNPQDEDSVIAMAPWLRKLGNNKAVVIDHVNDYLREAATTEMSGGYSSQSLVLKNIKGGYVRANLWERSRSYAGDTSWEDALYTYNFPHNHNFQLLTVGMWGPGYGTEIYELDVDRVIGYPGEEVGLQFLERTTLPEGKVMYYRRSVDVHTQLPPEAFSISLNLMPADSKIAVTEQYDFDIRARKIRDIVGGQVEAQVSLLTIAQHMGDDQTLELSARIATSNPNHRTRLAAYRCATALSGGDQERFWRQAADDRNPLVSRHAREALRELELHA